VYKKRVYHGFGKADPKVELRLGPNITDWPKIYPMQKNLLLELTAVIHDPVTTTDELIPSGETSSYRSNPVKLSDFALSRRAPGYVPASKEVRTMAESLTSDSPAPEIASLAEKLCTDTKDLSVGSCIVSKRPGDGSAREQAASCQKVLGGFANLCYDYATKRYRSNCINWGIVPFTMDERESFDFEEGDWLYIKGLRSGILNGQEEFEGKIISGDSIMDIKLYCRDLSEEERLILTEGCLMNYYAAGYGK
jgi:aconitate hydratase